MKLFQHQKDGIQKIVNAGGVGAFFWDVGCGKTLAALKTFEYYRRTEPTLKLFVVCPVSLIESAWGDDINKFTSFSYANLRAKLDLSADILIVNFETLISKKFAPTIKQILDIPTKMVVVDESQRIKSHSAKTTKYMLAMSRTFKYRLILSATPAPNSKLEYWPQMEFIRPGLLNSNFFSFRASFFCLIRGESVIPLRSLGRKEMIMMMQRGYKMSLIPGTESVISDRMAKYCQFVDKREVLDLPDEIDVIRSIEMTPDQKRAFSQMKRDLVTQIKEEEVSVPNALAKLMKLRQISSGFIYNSEGEAIEFDNNPKMKELENVIEEIGNKKIIIFCQYRWSIERICKKLQRKTHDLFGATTNKEESIQRFKSSSNEILVTHPSSGGVGLSFNDCDYMIFYSLDYSYMNYHQCRGRIMRAMKKNNATYIHLIVENSLDRTIMQALKGKHSDDRLFREIVGGSK